MKKLDPKGHVLASIRAAGMQIDDIAVELILHLSAAVDEKGGTLTIEELLVMREDMEKLFKIPPPEPPTMEKA
tara:strand:- start:2129 stop:2347 length:219 start_codon:yes stop_codon:yes gene_type:complete